MIRQKNHNFIVKSLAGSAVKALMALIIITLCFGLTACGGSGGGSGGSSGSGSSGSSSSSDASASKNEGEPGDYKIPKFRDAKFDDGSAEGNEEAKVDLSSASEGYIAVVCNSDARLKLQVFKDKDTYTYDVTQGTTQIYPLQCGNGSYTIKVMKNVEGNSYYELYKCSVDVKLKDKFQPYTRPNQYADYSKESECVKEAEKLAKEATSEGDFVAKVYEYVCGKVTYDYDFAKNVPTGYLPVPDKTLESGKGICLDYASLSASMLRSQGIPTKIIFGYVAPNDLYHAWNMFYTKKEGWVTVEFKTDKKNWNRLDLTFAANGESDEFIGDGSNYEDVYQY